MILATARTGFYEFSVAAPDKDTADAYLLDGYAKHVEQMDGLAEPEVMAEVIANDEVTYTELVVGVVFRDGEPFWPRPS